MRRRFIILVLCLIVFSIASCNPRQSELEGEYKRAAKLYQKFTQFSGQRNVISDKAQAYLRRVEEKSEDLKILVQSDPDSKWADEAYLLVALTIPSSTGKRRIKELESLLETYPEISPELWTIINAPSVVTTDDSGLITRVLWHLALVNAKTYTAMAALELCYVYEELGETDKLNDYYQAAMKKYPQSAHLFHEFFE